MAEPENADRELVDLLFFPTGGGKTEAYLGLAAFTMFLRRLRNPGSLRGCGVAVIMRYTLRLLTLDQLGRGAALICAMELERQKDVEKLGKWPFEIGLWVGQAPHPTAWVRRAIEMKTMPAPASGNSNRTRRRHPSRSKRARGAERSFHPTPSISFRTKRSLSICA